MPRNTTPKVVRVESNDMLPYAAYLLLFTNTKVLYKGKLIASQLKQTPEGRLVRCVEIDDFLYLEQEKLTSNSTWAKLARRGYKIVWIVHKPTRKTVGKVVNGKITRL